MLGYSVMLLERIYRVFLIKKYKNESFQKTDSLIFAELTAFTELGYITFFKSLVFRRLLF